MSADQGNGPTNTTFDEGRLVELAERALAAVPSGAEAVVRVDAVRHSLTRFANSRIHQNVSDERVAISVTVARNGRPANAATNRTDADGLAAVVADAADAAAVVPVDPTWAGVASRASTEPTGHWDQATVDADPDTRAALVAAFVAAGGSGQEAAGYCDTAAYLSVVATTDGQQATDRTSRATVDGIFLGSAEGGYTPAGYGHATSYRVADLDGADVGTSAADGAAAAVGAGEIEPGEYEVVLMPECVAEMLTFLGAYGFNAKSVQEGQSFVELGATTFDPAVTLVDDVFDPRSIGLGVDGEGTPTQRVTLVDGGTCTALVHDRRTAARAGVTSSGHGSADSGAWGPMPGSLVLGQGTATVADLVGGVKRGLLVTCFNYCRVLDPKTVGVTGLTRNGTFLIEDGRVVAPVTNLRFTQSMVEALAPGRVLGVGASARLADCEWGPGRVVAPALRLASWRFTGGAAG